MAQHVGRAFVAAGVVARRHLGECGEWRHHPAQAPLWWAFRWRELPPRWVACLRLRWRVVGYDSAW